MASAAQPTQSASPLLPVELGARLGTNFKKSQLACFFRAVGEKAPGGEDRRKLGQLLASKCEGDSPMLSAAMLQAWFEEAKQAKEADGKLPWQDWREAFIAAAAASEVQEETAEPASGLAGTPQTDDAGAAGPAPGAADGQPGTVTNKSEPEKKANLTVAYYIGSF